jgi:hypothetical protein
MKYVHVLVMTAVLLAIGCAPAKPVAVKPDPGQIPFDVVSAKRVDKVDSFSAAGHQFINTGKDENSVVVVLKSKSPNSLVYYSTDFSLGFDSADYASEIPRQQCVGISLDTSAGPENEWNWVLGGGVSRSRTEAGKPYFAVLFVAPKKVSEFTLYYATPVGTKVKLAQ